MATLRDYDPTDFEPLLAMWRAVSEATYTWLPGHTEAEDRAYLRDEIVAKSAITVAHEEDRLVGFLARQGDLVDRLYVAVDAQGRGIGTALLDGALAARPDGLRLFTHQRNTPARRFYEARGFRVRRLGISPPPECEPDVEYGWEPT